MIFAFHKPHAIGSVCCFPCSQCGDDPQAQVGGMIDFDGELWRQPFFIKREATRQEYVPQFDGRRALPVPEEWSVYYYEVSTD